MQRSEDMEYVALLATARAKLRAYDLAAAEHAARDVLRHDPDRGAAYNLLAIVRLWRGQLVEAKSMLRAGLAVDPTCHELKANLPRIGRVGVGPMLLGDELSTSHPYRS